MLATTVILALLTIILGSAAILLALEARSLSARLQAFMATSERNMADLVQDAARARIRWERLADQVEEAVVPISRVGALANRLESDVEALRAQYRDGAVAAARQIGWAVGAFRGIQELMAQESAPSAPRPPAPPSAREAAPARETESPTPHGATVASSFKGDLP